MNENERQTLVETIDLTLVLAERLSALNRKTTALERLVCRDPDLQKAYQTEFAEADDRGEQSYEEILAAARKLAVSKDRLRTTGTVYP